MAASGDTEAAPKGKTENKQVASSPCCGCGDQKTETAHESIAARLSHTLLCLQCAKCSGLCPAARFEPAFNPRSIVLSILNGTWQRLLKADSPIWACCVCLSCDEFCPQDVKPHEVVLWLRNEAFRSHSAPQKVSRLVASVRSSGASVALSRALLRRRQNLQLPQFSPAKPPSELFSGNDS